MAIGMVARRIPEVQRLSSVGGSARHAAWWLKEQKLAVCPAEPREGGYEVSLLGILGLRGKLTSRRSAQCGIVFYDLFAGGMWC
jgi:hypothetical protein